MCVKRITLCNCLCSSSYGSASVIRNIVEFGAENYFTDHRRANTIHGFKDSVEGRAFYSRLATLLSLKNGIGKSKVTSWIRSKVNFVLLRSMLLRVSRQKLVNKKVDIELELTNIKKK